MPEGINKSPAMRRFKAKASMLSILPSHGKREEHVTLKYDISGAREKERGSRPLIN